jgi:hypothetical protein
MEPGSGERPLGRSSIPPAPPHPAPTQPLQENESNTKFAASAALWPSELTIVWARIDPRSGLGSG